MARLPFTRQVRAALAEITAAERVHVPGRDPSSQLELPKLALADAVLDAVRARRLARVPRARMAKAATPSRRRRHAS
ncbi:MAG TPA: hypothetical protein VFA59_16905 [Vicinamibacterales bacterium]|nr:hypothetical protein [Vicinamibacterales bacterium]